MHEINIVRSMVKTVTEFARENKLDRVTEIVLDIGEVSMTTTPAYTEYVEELYPLVAKGTMLEDTKLVINMIPGMAECNECDEIYNLIEQDGRCPNCGSLDKTVLSGKDFTIREIHIPE